MTICISPGHSEVRRHDGLHPLLATDPDPDVRGLDHRDVIGAVPDGQRVHLELLLHYPNQVGFLKLETS